MSNNNTSWVDALAVDEVPADDLVAVEVQGRDIAVYSIDGEIHATSNVCTHGNARLCDGFLLGDEIECPLHQGRFDVRTGKALCAPLTEDLPVYPVKIENGRVWIALEA
ncbi:Naphthalene 1,2-dioxygenase/salicylate 5-hydroxylase systems, ferredoxin component [Burkholderiales bacterium 8X]|nr:Naphthalene 1,2-dioxygenase/salicylate 5-hydroxylase systems, ferredoxin component [Burkholderiales bacterium 8X]